MLESPEKSSWVSLVEWNGEGNICGHSSNQGNNSQDRKRCSWRKRCVCRTGWGVTREAYKYVLFKGYFCQLEETI